jgi:prolyl-tRNA editing enzyme YbaK/EbsC (Cys-tRNA(Pro) deacylase)
LAANAAACVPVSECPGRIFRSVTNLCVLCLSSLLPYKVAKSITPGASTPGGKGGAGRSGLQAAEALGEEPGRALKTLMALVDGKPVCVILPSDREESMKKLAAAFDGKSAEVMKPADAERITGYKTDGISPFGQTRKIPAVIEEHTLEHDLVYRPNEECRLDCRCRTWSRRSMPSWHRSWRKIEFC